VKYENGGGRVVISGQVGTRHGLERFLWHRDSGSTLAEQLKLDDASFVCPDPPGKAYYEDIADGQRSDGRPLIKQAIEHCLADSTPLVKTNAPLSVGLFAFYEPDGAVAIDLVNYNIDPPTDQLTPANGLLLTVNPPRGKRFPSPRATLFSPNLRERITDTTAEKGPTPWRYKRVSLNGKLQDDGSLEFEVPEFTVSCTLSVPVKSGSQPPGATTLLKETN
jgi:hypothetical protein